MRRLALVLLSALLSACAGMRLVEIDVRALSTLNAPELAEGASYRFERLLSQAAQPQAQAELEAIVERATPNPTGNAMANKIPKPVATDLPPEKPRRRPRPQQ